MKKIIVSGLGRSGIAILKYFKDKEQEVFAYDSNDKIDPSKLKEFENSKNIKIFLGQNPKGDEDAKIVYISPGISLYTEYVQNFLNRGVQVTGDIELAYNIAKDANFIGITGTNGKTTTTSILGDIYKLHDKNSYVVGNIGNAILESVLQAKPKANFITELSSFQLESIIDFRPHIGAILNITPDHIERHKTMQNYKNAKYNIAKNQTEDDILVLNKDDKEIDIDISKLKSKVYYFSMQEKIENGVYYDKETMDIVSTLDGKQQVIINRRQIDLLGDHNIKNVLASVLIALLDNIDKETIYNAIKHFKAVRHRMQKVREIDGVIYVNDSKGTNPDSTINAIKSIENPIILIAGGYDKKVQFDELIKTFEGKVKHLILFGDTKNQLKETSLKYGFENITMLNTLKECTLEAKKIAKKGDYVLLSPACASWDMYDNFEQRGDEFIDIVNEF